MKNGLHKIAVWYGKCLSAGIGPGDPPAPAYAWILIICPTALLIAFVLWLPVNTAIQSGVPITGYIHTYNSKRQIAPTFSYQAS